ncbi:MAG: response regulator receiver protein [Bacteroidetes bacterium]|nr:response regulator receiver protein [Bacteroidota bacterium]
MLYKNLMLIDDDDDDQEIFLTAVKAVSDKATCSSFFNAEEALKQLISGREEPEVIFLDLNMPVMNGQQFLIEIKKIDKLKAIPVIIFSTSSHAPTIQATKDLGASDFITKPASFDALKEILKQIIA